MRISTIIPAYNCAAYLPEAIRSVLTQSRPADEIIVVDDGSTDDTPTVVKPFLDEIVYLRTPNQGAACARNMGLRRASGDWVSFLDADDGWFPRKLELQVQLLKRCPDVIAVCSEFSLVNEHGAVQEERHIKNKYRIFRAYSLDWPDIFPDASALDLGHDTVKCYHGAAFKSLFLGNFVNTSSMLLRRDLLEDIGCFTAGRATQEDYEAWLKLALRGPMAYIDRPLLFFRRRPHQLTSDDQRLRIAEDTADVVSQFMTVAGARLGDRVAGERVADLQCSLALAYLGTEQRRAARRALRFAVNVSGVRMRPVLLWGWSWMPGRVAVVARRMYRWLRPRGHGPVTETAA